jgi:acetylornithine/succinyldiaminopimelate/putrescine aminotransferase
MFGKWLGNGFPVTVLAVREGLRDVLQQTQPSSTFGGQPLACARPTRTTRGATPRTKKAQNFPSSRTR